MINFLTQFCLASLNVVFKKNALNSFTAYNTRKLEENDNQLKRRPEMLTKQISMSRERDMMGTIMAGKMKTLTDEAIFSGKYWTARPRDLITRFTISVHLRSSNVDHTITPWIENENYSRVTRSSLTVQKFHTRKSGC